MRADDSESALHCCESAWVSDWLEDCGESSFCGEEFGFGGGTGERELLHDDGGFDGAGLFEQVRGGGLVDSGGCGDDALGAVDELGVGGLHVDHEVAVDGSGFDHDAGAQHVEDELGGGSGFEARAAGEDFGAGDGGDGDVGRRRPSASWGRR